MPHDAPPAAPGRLNHCPAPCDRRTPGLLRALARRLAEEWGLDRDTRDLLEQACSELGTNAVRHARSDLWATVGTNPPGPARPAQAYVTVADRGPGTLRLPGPRQRIGGHGLILLARSGMRVEQLRLGDGLSRVHAWTPLAAGERGLVCPCPCWADRRGPSVPAHRCAELIRDGGGKALLHGQRVLYCTPCAARAEALTARATVDSTLSLV
jgi:anti-sigma regulatory factor (Ser/Thr protein kinase)